KSLARIKALEAEISERQANVASQVEIVSAERRLKLLYSGTGDDLVAVAASALRELGLNVIEGPKRRADLVLWDGGGLLVAAEVKGLDGAARENNFRQTERWIAELNAALSMDPADRADDPELEQYGKALTELGLDVSRPSSELTCRGLMII